MDGVGLMSLPGVEKTGGRSVSGPLIFGSVVRRRRDSTGFIERVGRIDRPTDNGWQFPTAGRARRPPVIWTRAVLHGKDVTRTHFTALGYGRGHSHAVTNKARHGVCVVQAFRITAGNRIGC